MSLNAYIWAANLPLNVVSSTAFRVLLKYADRADERGLTSWHTAGGLADMLGCSKRTAQRAIAELVECGLLVEGDQRFVSHLRGDRRPVVYDLPMSAEVQAQLPGYGFPNDTTKLSPRGERYDRFGHDDTTPAVALGTVIEPTINTSSTRYRGNVTPSSVPPAPRYPKFTREPKPAPPAPLTDEELGAIRAASELACPKGAGTGATARHWFPANQYAECARCGAHASRLINPKGNS